MAYIREWRQWRGLSQRELAGMSGVAYTTISRVESGATQPAWATVAKLAKALGITREQLLHQEPG